MDFDFNNEDDITNFIETNIKKITTKKSTMRAISKKNKELFKLNIPKLLLSIPSL